jgi:hypothetical protein
VGVLAKMAAQPAVISAVRVILASTDTVIEQERDTFTEQTGKILGPAARFRA